jgi:hypothetical protein
MSHSAMSRADSADDTTPVMARWLSVLPTTSWMASTAIGSMPLTSGRKLRSSAVTTGSSRKLAVKPVPIRPSSVSTSQNTKRRSAVWLPSRFLSRNGIGKR